MIQMPSLIPGDEIGIVGPAYSVSFDDLQPAIQKLKSWGLHYNLGENLFRVNHLFAGTDDERAHDLDYMLNYSRAKAVLCARGGYGCLRILDKINFNPDKPTTIIGFSDITALLIKAYNAGLESIHGPVATSFTGKHATSLTLEKLRRLLMDNGPIHYTFSADRPDLTRPGKGTGRIIGGNLSILSQLLGTPTDFETEGCILFLEDLDEYLYALDRMVVHLKRGGKLNNLAGLIVGGMTEMKDNYIPFGLDPYEIIADAVHGFSFPVAFGFPLGHRPENYPLPVGRMATLQVSHSRTELSF